VWRIEAECRTGTNTTKPLMRLARTVRNILRASLQKYGSEAAKRRLWNDEYATGRWNCLDNSGDRSAYLLVEKYANKGGILDLGCGTGTMGIALTREAYSFYTGLDLSDVAIDKAKQRALDNGCGDRNEFYRADILTYQATHKYKVILYGDSIYYIPQGKIVPMLERYSAFLADDGVFIARLFEASGKRLEIIDMIQTRFHVVESHLDQQTLAYLVVFRPHGQ
jgi:2-polyprenyl-3-methyl-5-hydroxy-6-metoxy-1,4-benzoquinol methylase